MRDFLSIYKHTACMLSCHTFQKSRSCFNFSVMPVIICAPCAVFKAKGIPKTQSYNETGVGASQSLEEVSVSSGKNIVLVPGWLCFSTHCTNTLDQEMLCIKNKPLLPKAKVYLAELTNQAPTHIKASVRLQPTAHGDITVTLEWYYIWVKKPRWPCWLVLGPV